MLFKWFTSINNDLILFKPLIFIYLLTMTLIDIEWTTLINTDFTYSMVLKIVENIDVFFGTPQFFSFLNTKG